MSQSDADYDTITTNALAVLDRYKNYIDDMIMRYAAKHCKDRKITANDIREAVKVLTDSEWPEL